MNYLELVLVDCEDGRFVMNEYPGRKIAFHLRLNRWSPGFFKELRRRFDEILSELSADGIEEVYATPYEADPKAVKLITLFGFEEFARGADRIVMRRRLTCQMAA